MHTYEKLFGELPRHPADGKRISIIHQERWSLAATDFYYTQDEMDQSGCELLTGEQALAAVRLGMEVLTRRVSDPDLDTTWVQHSEEELVADRAATGGWVFSSMPVLKV